MVRILMVGCNEPDRIVVDALRSRGFHVDYVEKVKIPNPLKLRDFSVIYGAHLQTCSRYIAAAEILGKKTIIHFVGSDAYRYAQEKGLRKLFWKKVVDACDLILYVSPHLRELVGKKGTNLPFPIRATSLRRSKGGRSPDRDVLYYCPGGKENAKIYRRDWILNYAQNHPEMKVTIIGNRAQPAEKNVNMPNVEVIPFIPYDKMEEVYARHKQLIRMTTQNGLPRMLDEALLCGLEVIFNGKRITEIQPERDPVVFAQRFEKELRRIL